MEDPLVELGRQLEAARKSKGWSARMAAERARISPVYLRTLENGKNPNTGKPSQPTPEILVRVATALNLDPESLLTLAGHDAKGVLNDESLPAVNDVRAALDRMSSMANRVSDLHPFMRDRAVSEVERFAADFRRLANGSFRCLPEEEPQLTRTALKGSTKSIKAVSFGDEGWWLGDRGSIYLDYHDRLPATVKVQRIFLVKEEWWERLKPVFRRHEDAGVEWRVLAPREVAPQYQKDFVVYDDRLLRSVPLGPVSSAEFKPAIFTQDRLEIEQAVEEFEYLQTVVDSYYIDRDRLL